MKIRPFTASDRNALVNVFKLNIPLYFAPHEAGEYEEYLYLHGATYFTIERDSKIIGGIGYIIKGQEGNIAWIFTHPDYSGKGIGKQAVEYCLSILRSDAAVKRLIVRTSQLAYIFFEKFGYKVIYTEKDYWGIGLDFYLMEMEK